MVAILILPVIVVVVLVGLSFVRGNNLSFKTLLQAAVESMQRFPLAWLCALVSLGLSTALVYQLIDEATFGFQTDRILATFVLGISVFVAITLIGEAKPGLMLPLQVFGIIFLGVFFQQGKSSSSELFYSRYAQYILAAHLLVSVAFYYGRTSIQGFWRFNQLLFARCLGGVSLASIVFAGFSIALLALHYLLEVDVDGETYATTWLLCGFILCTAIVLAGVPKEQSEVETDFDYPRALEVLCNFVLIPFATLYLLILYLYSGKILFLWQLPKGLVGWLVCSFAVLGTFGWLLAYPLRDHALNLSKFFLRNFFWLLYPLLALLAVAIWERTSAYGITEKRYFLVVLTLWLGGITVYFTVFKGKNIRAIPASLAVLAILTSFGPWGAYEVSLRSQFSRLRVAFDELGIVAHGKTSSPATLKQGAEITSLLEYLVSVHGLNSIRPLVAKNTEALEAIDKATDPVSLGLLYNWRVTEYLRNTLMPKLGLSYVDRWQSTSGNQRDTSFYFARVQNQPVTTAIDSYEYMVSGLNLHSWNAGSNTSVPPTSIGNRNFTFHLSEKFLEVSDGNWSKPLKFELDAMLSKAAGNKDSLNYNNYATPEEALSLSAEHEDVKIKIIFLTINGSVSDGSFITRSATPMVLISWKK